jgi:hypothetical protein
MNGVNRPGGGRPAGDALPEPRYFEALWDIEYPGLPEKQHDPSAWQELKPEERPLSRTLARFNRAYPRTLQL